MNWLFKEEPTHYSFDALVTDKKTTWSGVKNALAQKHLHAVRKGDRIFYYHTGDEKAVIGIAKALGDAYPDPEDPDRKAGGRRRRAGDEAAASRHARRDQGRPVVQGLPARADLPVVGDAGHRRGVDAHRSAGE